MAQVDEPVASFVVGIVGLGVAVISLVIVWFSYHTQQKSREESAAPPDSSGGQPTAPGAQGGASEPPRRRGDQASKGGQTRNTRPMRVMVVVFGTFVCVLLEILCWVPRTQLWLWFLSLLPAMLVVHHGIQLAVFKNRRFFDDTQEPNLPRMDASSISIVRAAMKEERQYYGTASLALRFALPALVLIVANMTLGYSLSDPPEWGSYVLDAGFIAGAQVAALGAYVYVLIFLGGRALRGDITPSSIWWCIVTMAAGTLLGGILSVMFIGKDLGVLIQTPGAPAEQAEKVSVWSTLLLPFAAGFSLRYIVSFVNEVIRRVIGGQVAAATRIVSLVQLRGIDRDIEERLAEEGIIDVSTLSMANPTKLRRNTRFDKRQILSWIDEALLVTYLPSSWQSLESDGVTGAIDLIWYACFMQRKDLSEPRQPLVQHDYDRIVELAKRNKIPPDSLMEAIFRMKEDAQVSLIRGLYQLDDTESTDGSSNPDSPVTPGGSGS